MNIKKILWGSAAILIIAGIFDMLCFWLVDEYTTSFYICIAFGNASIFVYALSSLLMARKGKYIYLSLQDGCIIGSYTVICVILNLCFALFGMNNVKANIMVNLIILAVYLVFLFFIFANTAAITAQLEHDRKDRNALYDLQDRARLLLNRGNNLQVNKKLESLYDKISSCQISRTVNVSAIDSQILTSLNDLATYLSDESLQDIVFKEIKNLMLLIDDRNRQIAKALRR